MTKFSCYIVDDESDAIALLKEYIEATPGLELLGYSQNPVDALEAIPGVKPDITFIDVDMRLLSGIELAGMINLYTWVVFTTAFPSYALQAFDKGAFDYLLKPITYERFVKCIQKAKTNLARKPEVGAVNAMAFFNIQSEIKGRMFKVCHDEVIYIEGAVNYIYIHTAEEVHKTYLTIQEIERRLPPNIFVRVHRSFIVNVNHVKIIERGQLKLDNDTYLTLGGHYKQPFLDLMDAHLIKTNRA